MAQAWLHCNECFYQPDKKGLRFFLTNCSHIFCEKCVNDCTKDKCKLCKATCTTMPLSGKIPKTVQEMFSDPVDYFKKQIRPCIQIFEFHKCHQKRLYRHLGQRLKTLEANIVEAKKVMTQAKQIEREFRRLKTENDYLKKLISKKDSHPRHPSPGHFISPSYYADSPDKGTPRNCHSQFSRGPSPSPGLHSRGPSPGHHSRGPSPGHHMKMNNSPGHRRGPSPGHHMKMNNSFNGRLLVRSPPEGGKLGSVHDIHLTPENRRMVTTPDSGYSGADFPLTVPRPIHFGSQD